VTAKRKAALNALARIAQTELARIAQSELTNSKPLLIEKHGVYGRERQTRGGLYDEGYWRFPSAFPDRVWSGGT
jgi:hypothetical protein